MLFSDIEGSTVLLRRLGSDYVHALDGQRTIMRAAWAAYDGVEMGTEGDSFFVAFHSAPAAVGAAVRAQRNVTGHAWPQAQRVRVRIGIHTGSPIVHDGGYVGMDVHRAARIAGAAHGGQVIVSAATRLLAEERLDPSLDFLDLGDHQLKDLPAPERLFQVKIPDLQVDFPPIKSLGASSSLPSQRGQLVGRDDDMAMLVQLLSGGSSADERVRLLTLTGPGGSGKSRLALALAWQLSHHAGRFPDGVFFVPLALVDSAEPMWAAIAEILDVPASSRVWQRLIDRLRNRTLLLVLDNLEQVDGASAVISELLQNVPAAVMVTTSRWPLHLVAEHEYEVSPLALSASDDPVEVSGAASTQMFVQAARRVQPDFSVTAENARDVAAICRRLDGLPLALELAAARLKMLAPHAIVTRLDRVLDLASADRDVPTRQRTLRETIDWSYRLLKPEQQLLFCRLGVFSGGADLAAIDAVAGDIPGDLLDRVGELVDASLVRVSEGPGGEPRFWLLETVRAYAVDMLRKHGELERARYRHADHFASVAEALQPVMRGPRYLEAYGRFTLEHDNLRAALALAVDEDANTRHRDPEPPEMTGMRIVSAMVRYSRTSGRYAEEAEWIAKLLSIAGDVDHPLVARCQRMLAAHGMASGPMGGRELARSSIAMSRRLGDTAELVEAMVALADFDLDDDLVDAAEALVNDAVRLTREIGDPRIGHRVDMQRVQIEVLRGHFERALEILDEAYGETASDHSPLDRLSADHERAWILRRMGRSQEALRWIRAATEIAVTLEFAWRNGINFLGEDYAGILAELGDAPGTARLLGAVDARREALAFPRTPAVDRDLADSLGKARAALTPSEWERYYHLGRGLQLEEALVTAESWHG